VNFPIFVFHELIVRLSEINPIIGRYISNEPKADSYIITTYNGTLIIPSHFLQMQYENPKLMDMVDLAMLANNFRAYPGVES